ncbi:MAG: hypothetical protein RLZZ609_1168 [Cyanobacteriota bacterium]|jgi:hypothetical protein
MASQHALPRQVLPTSDPSYPPIRVVWQAAGNLDRLSSPHERYRLAMGWQ